MTAQQTAIRLLQKACPCLAIRLCDKMIKTPQQTADEILRNTSSVESALNVVNKILKFTPYHKLIYHYWRVKLIFLNYKYIYGWQ